jgi:hypothetical protein
MSLHHGLTIHGSGPNSSHDRCIAAVVRYMRPDVVPDEGRTEAMLPHATRTDDDAFMSVYAWHGDLSTEYYVYAGLPADD